MTVFVNVLEFIFKLFVVMPRVTDVDLSRIVNVLAVLVRSGFVEMVPFCISISADSIEILERLVAGPNTEISAVEVRTKLDERIDVNVVEGA